MRRVRMAARALRRSCGTPAARSRPSAAGVTSSGATSRALSSSFREIPIVDKKFVEALSERIKAGLFRHMTAGANPISGGLTIPFARSSRGIEQGSVN